MGGEPYRYVPLGKHIVRAFGVCGGRPTFKYTRIEVEGTLGRLAAGETIASIIAGYDGRVSQEAIEIATRRLIETLPQRTDSENYFV